MTLTVEAIYENGMLKPAQPLPLKEGEQVRITLQPAADQVSTHRPIRAADQTYGMIGWSGDAATFERLFKESEADRWEPST